MKKLSNKKYIVKILVVFIILILNNSKISAVDIQVIHYSCNVSDTDVTILVEINLTLAYRVYENDSEITNGTLFAYTLANVTTPRNLTPGITITHSFFINYSNPVWLNFSYSNYPLIPEFKTNMVLSSLAVFIGLGFVSLCCKRKENL